MSINVLSLFDGISCGQVALQRVGIVVDNYYASEIDKHAIKITQKNFPETIQIGSVEKVNGFDYAGIDLLIGGSPCIGFSFAGKKLNFEDPQSKLFFEYIRILREAKPKFFLLENVYSLRRNIDTISKYVGVEPIEINSNKVSAQNRRRLYWTNIKGVKQPKDKGILLKDVLDDVEDFVIVDKKYKKKSNSAKSSCLTGGAHSGGNHSDMDLVMKTELYNIILKKNQTKASCLLGSGGGVNCGTDYISVSKNGSVRRYTPKECERLQTLPEGYTEGISNSQRYKALGNAWTVDVIAHIFSYLPWSEVEPQEGITQNKLFDFSELMQ